MGAVASQADSLIEVCTVSEHDMDSEMMDLRLRSLETGKTFDVASVTSLPSQTLRARFQMRAANTAPRDRDGRPIEFPDSYRFFSKHSFKVLTTDGHQYLLQVASTIDHRRPEWVSIDVEDCAAVQTLAHKFNIQLGEELGSEVFICTSTAVEIVHSRLPAVLGVGDVALVIPFKGNLADIQKFVFNPKTDAMVDLPSAFFHYSLFITQGHEMVYDLQGEVDENGDLYLIDPVVLPGNLSDTVVGCGPVGGPSNNKASTTFEALHPTCSPLCKLFDPTGKAKTALRANNGVLCGGCGV